MFITHDMAVVAQIADKVVVMYRGNKVEEGPVEQIFAKPQHPYTRRFWPPCRSWARCEGKALPEPMKLFNAPEGRRQPQPIVGTDKVLLKVENLVTRFPVKGGFLRRTIANVHAVEDVSFARDQVGPDAQPRGRIGCGKSTAGRSILRLVEPLSGKIDSTASPTSWR
jgi:ABC-type glutathione transport system ATPase component